ncbi:hypothetical protein HMPREF1624_01283 [Sporothrix schenckii ATCC 58251]|uniref:CAP20 n=1 Tax=Sporothrix schenckii (strain ATCC 58251 / de Perez 2211183) TaxID=1391915 RepID=U7Q528_SPOS1|nr:hypothetical protein HMPREF1624_01283 [Sporothrix schenckii ATCC 58251]
MASPQVNGVSPQSAFLEHLLQYPLVSDSVSTVKENKYGQQTLALSTSAYETLAKPVLPYLSKPYGYVSPYVKKADSLGDRTLDSLDQRFPVVRKPTAEVYQETKDFVWYPVRKATEGRDHVFSVYSGERKQVGGDGVLPAGKAVALTAITVTSETLAWVRTYLSAAKKQADASISEKTPNGTN